MNNNHNMKQILTKLEGQNENMAMLRQHLQNPHEITVQQQNKNNLADQEYLKGVNCIDRQQ